MHFTQALFSQKTGKFYVQGKDFLQRTFLPHMTCDLLRWTHQCPHVCATASQRPPKVPVCLSHGPHCSVVTKCVWSKPCVSPSPSPGLGSGLRGSQQTTPENRLGSGPSTVPPTLHPASPTHPTPHTCSFQPCLPLPTLPRPHDACRSYGQSVLPVARVVKNPFQ